MSCLHVRVLALPGALPGLEDAGVERHQRELLPHCHARPNADACAGGASGGPADATCHAWHGQPDPVVGVVAEVEVVVVVVLRGGAEVLVAKEAAAAAATSQGGSAVRGEEVRSNQVDDVLVGGERQ